MKSKLKSTLNEIKINLEMSLKVLERYKLNIYN